MHKDMHEQMFFSCYKVPVWKDRSGCSMPSCYFLLCHLRFLNGPNKKVYHELSSNMYAMTYDLKMYLRLKVKVAKRKLQFFGFFCLFVVVVVLLLFFFVVVFFFFFFFFFFFLFVCCCFFSRPHRHYEYWRTKFVKNVYKIVIHTWAKWLTCLRWARRYFILARLQI